MKLSEIYRTGPQATSNIPLNAFDLNNLKQVATGEGGIPIVMTHAIDSKQLLLYGITLNNKLICYIAGELHNINGVEYFIIGGSWADIQYRKRGYMTSLYTTIIKILKVKILSDQKLSDDAIDLWNSISKNHNVQVLDIKNNKILPRNQVPDNKIFQNQNPNLDDYRLILEYITPTIPPIGSGILHDYLVYTHLNNIGLYD